MKRGEIKERNPTFERRWSEFFVASPEVCSRLWDLCDPYNTMPNAVKPVHLLWALLFMKQYQTETLNSTLVAETKAKDEKTFRKWSWLFLREISYIESRVVSKRNRVSFNCCNATQLTCNLQFSILSFFRLFGRTGSRVILGISAWYQLMGLICAHTNSLITLRSPRSSILTSS